MPLDTMILTIMGAAVFVSGMAAGLRNGMMKETLKMFREMRE